MRAALCVLLAGCNLYVADEPPASTAPTAVYRRGCIRSITAGPGALVVTSGCDDTDLVEKLRLERGTFDQLSAHQMLGVGYWGMRFGDIDGLPGDETIGIVRGDAGAYVEWASGATAVPQRVDFLRPFADLFVADINGDHRGDVVVVGDGMILAGLGKASGLPSETDERVLLENRQFVTARFAPHGPEQRLYYAAPGAGGKVELGIALPAGLEFAIQRFDTDAHGPILPMTTADIDGDGELDVVGAASRVYVHSSVHDAFLFLDETPVAVAAGDLDGDGVDDVVYLAADRTTVRRVRLSSDGVMAAESLLTARGTALAVGDLDGDGKADIAVLDGIGLPSSTVSVYRM